MSSFPAGSNCEVELKTRWSPSAENRFLTRPSSLAGVEGSIDPFIPWTRLPFGMCRGTPWVPSAKHGLQISGPPKAKVPSDGSASARVEENGDDADGLFAGIPTYEVVQPLSLRVAT